MTLFKEVADEAYLTTPEAKELLADVEESRELVEELLELEKVDEATAYKITDLLPEDRDELRTVFAQGRYTLSGDELDDVLDVVVKYA